MVRPIIFNEAILRLTILDYMLSVLVPYALVVGFLNQVPGNPEYIDEAPIAFIIGKWSQ